MKSFSMSLLQITNPSKSGDASVGFTPACQTSPLCSKKICDTSLSQSKRIASLINDLTLEEKILNLVDASAGSERIGLPSYEWWNEATHGVGSAPGVQFTNKPMNYSYATSFPSPILSSAAFDDELIAAIGNVVGREGRAFGNGGFSGFDFWAPNMNPFRDPRWGRGQETPGEDILRVKNYVRSYVPGLQGQQQLRRLWEWIILPLSLQPRLRPRTPRRHLPSPRGERRRASTSAKSPPTSKKPWRC